MNKKDEAVEAKRRANVGDFTDEIVAVLTKYVEERDLDCMDICILLTQLAIEAAFQDAPSNKIAARTYVRLARTLSAHEERTYERSSTETEEERPICCRITEEVGDILNLYLEITEIDLETVAAVLIRMACQAALESTEAREDAIHKVTLRIQETFSTTLKDYKKQVRDEDK